MDFSGINIFESSALMWLMTRLAFNLIITFIIVRLIYYPLKRDKDYVFTFLIFNLLIFFVSYFMQGLDVKMGFGFGLFALFTILRYRTITIPIKEMTYLFTVIVIAVINALSNREMSIAVILASNIAIVVIIFLLEKVWFRVPQGFQIITYENIDLVKPDKSTELVNDLKERTGLDITDIEIDTINYLNDTARIKIYYNKHQAGGVSRIAEDR